MIPSGYKDGKVYSIKPTNGDGDLTFTRSNDTATRVGPDGLIEKVRTNVALYSEDFSNGVYTKTTGVSVTANNAANPIDGALTADTIIYDGSGGGASYRIYSSPVAPSAVGVPYTWSVYLRSATPITVLLNPNIAAAIQINVTSTWQRFSVSGVGNGGSSVQTLIYSNYGDNAAFQLEAFGTQVETSDIATDYIATTTAAVSVGPVANLPRLDYLDSSCPKLLLEPQRTNLITHSEQFDNAVWNPTEMTVVANNATSPDGYTNADKLIPSTNASSHYLVKSTSFSGVGSMSVYAKADGYNQLILLNSAGNVNFNLSSGTISSGLNGTIVSVGNGWYRCSVSQTFSNGTIYISCGSSTAASFFNGAGDGTSGVLLYGATLEAGSYSTSYIPTLSAASTRGADSAYKTGVSSLIGQTEGTLFVEMDKDFAEASERYIAIGDGGTANRLMIIGGTGGSIRGFISASGVLQFDVSTGSAVGNHKVAIAYAANDIAFYVDGVQIALDTSAIIPAVSNLYLGTHEVGLTERLNGGAKQALLFKTRLTNAELAALTTI
tara:strand:- start:1030 stop:2682 length:1653 start_codon:yes stop_codon:yes gene_type:complete